MLLWALSVWISLEIEKLEFGRKDSRVLRLLRRKLAAAEDVAAALLKEESALSISSPDSPRTERARSRVVRNIVP